MQLTECAKVRSSWLLCYWASQEFEHESPGSWCLVNSHLSQLNSICTSTSSRFCSMVLTCGRWLSPPGNIWMQHSLRIPYTAHVSNLTVCKQTSQCRVISTIPDQRLKLFGHIYWTDPSQSHPVKHPSTRRLVRPDDLGWFQDSEHRPLLSLAYLTQTFQLASCWVNSYTLGGGSHQDFVVLYTFLVFV